MRSKFAKGSAFLAIISAFALAPALARADRSDEPLRNDFPKPSDNPALVQWRDARTWRYNTEYLFGVTRGLRDQGIPLWCEGAAWVVTVPLDLTNLPFATLAGLFGD